MTSYTTRAICLKAIDYGESDRILTLYSPDAGRISAIAKGARKAKSKLSGACELLNLSEVQLARGKSMDVLCQYQPIDAFVRLRTHILKLAFATVFAEEVQVLAKEHDEDSEQIFTLLQETLKRLEAVADEEILPVSTGFQLRLLNSAGYQPLLDACIACDQGVDFAGHPYFGFSPDLGGVLCHECRYRVPVVTVVNVSTATLQVLAVPSEKGWAESNGLKVQKFLHYYFAYKLERKLRSADFLYQLLS